MPDEITIKPKSESTSAADSAEDRQKTNQGLSEWIGLCALGLGVSFFLPWANYLFGTLSGFDLQKLGGMQRLLWLIPILCAVTIFAGFTKHSQQITGQLTGILPFCAAIYWYIKLGSDLTRILTYGAYLSGAQCPLCDMPMPEHHS